MCSHPIRKRKFVDPIAERPSKKARQHVAKKPRQRAVKQAKPAESTHAMETRRVRATKTSNAVFFTTELLEKILCELPAKDLSQARAVSKKFKAVVDTTPSLAYALFMRNNDAKPPLWIHDLKEEGLHVYKPGEEKTHERGWMDRVRCAHPGIVNPLLLNRDPEAACGSIPLRQRFISAEPLTLVKGPILDRFDTSIYANMHLTNPPCQKIVVQPVASPSWLFISWQDAILSNRWIEINNPDGVTWANLQSGLRAHINTKRLHKPRYRDMELKVYLEYTKVWAVGVVFPDKLETSAVEMYQAPCH